MDFDFTNGTIDTISTLDCTEVQYTETPGFQVVDFGGTVVGSNSTGLVGATIYNATILVNNTISYPLSFLGSSVATFTALVAAINAVINPTATAAIIGGNIWITSATPPVYSSTILWTDGSPALAASLTGFVALDPPVPGSANSPGVLTIIGTGALVLPQGTTAQEPSSPTGGMFRYNQTTTQLEFYNGTTWLTLTNSAGSVTSFQTSLSGLTPSTATTGAITLAGTLGATSGGTGSSSAPTSGQFLYSSGGTTYAPTTLSSEAVTTFSGGTTGLTPSSPTSGAVTLAGTLGLANGGTNSSTLGTAGAIIYDTGTALADSSGATGQALLSGGASAPTWRTVASTLTTNQILEGNGSGAFTANGGTFQGSGSFSGVTLNGTVTNPTDATTKAYVDNAVAGLSWKQAVQARTTTNLNATYANGASGVGATLTDNTTGTVLVLDGYTVQLNDRVLIANQSPNTFANGIYTLTTVGVTGTTPYVLTRTTDNDISSEMDGAAVFVERGTLYADTAFVQTAVQPITIGTTPITWVQFSGSGTYTAGSGLTLTGTQFNVNTDGTTTYINGSNQVAVDSSATAGQVLVSTGTTGTTATWSTVQLGNTNAVSGTLAVGNGGTGATTFTSNGVLYGNSTGAIQATAVGAAGTVLTGTGGAPAFALLTGIAVTSFQTSLSGLTPSTATTGAVTLAGTLGATSGGTGSSTAPTSGQILYSSGGTTYAPTTLTSVAVTSFDLNDTSTTPIYTTSPTTPTGGAVASTITLTTQTANTIFAGPATGGATQPTFRATVYADIVSSAIKLYAENASTPTNASATGTNAVAIGNGSLASATNSFAVGSGSNASIYSTEVFANGDAATAGDAQWVHGILRNITTNATLTELFLDGTGASQRLILPNNSAWIYNINLVGRRTDATGSYCAFAFQGLIYRDATAATTTISGNSRTNIAKIGLTVNPTVTADVTHGSLLVQVTGVAAETVRWVADVQLVQVTN